MASFLAGICIKTNTSVCPNGSFQVPQIALLVGAFVLIGLIGLGWLAGRSRRP